MLLRERTIATELLAPGRRDRGELHVILDGARDDRVHFLTRESAGSWEYLEDGIIEPSYRVCAPRLIALEHWPQASIARLLDEGWGRSWGVFVRSHRNFRTLLEHLRALHTARLPSGQIVQFRFYDPRVLRAYLPTCTADELAQVFGPIHEIVLESEDPATALRYSLAQRELVAETIYCSS